MRVSVEELLSNGPVVDVRSPSEFAQGHIPGAQNIPLFSDQERHEVGLCYKEKGQQEAIRLGLEKVQVKLTSFVDQANEVAPDREIAVYCWRGGMRSASMSWLFETAGLKTNVLEGGYKEWRKYAQQTIRAKRNYLSLTGFTGVGKTEILWALRDQGEQILDLEGLANHQGSAFVSVEREQPSTEHFENMVADALIKLDPNEPIWIEDESRSIGKVIMDNDFYQRVVTAPIILVTRPHEDRVKYLCEMYGEGNSDVLTEGFERIRKRMGGQNVKAALEYLENGNMEAAARIAMVYYDKAYLKSMGKTNRVPLKSISLKNKTYNQIATELKEWKKEHTTNSQD